MAHKTGLGRGLDALIPGGDEIKPITAGVMQIAVDKIQPNPRQPRVHFDPAELQELSDSVRAHGILQPLIVSPSDRPGVYVLIAGERRLLAARQAGLETVPVIVREVSEQDRLELALIENVQRADLGPLEAAEAYRQLADEFNLSHEEISARVGKNRATITNTLRLLKLAEPLKNALAEGQISEGHARALLTLPTNQGQIAALQTVLNLGLNVRQTEELARKLCGVKPTKSQKAAPPPEVSALEERLRHYLGTKVTLNHHHDRGTLVIHYYSEEELDALITRLMPD